MSCTLVIDQGTHASRALIYSARGEPVDGVEESVGLVQTGHERVEQDPRQLLDSVHGAAARLLARNPGCVRQAALATQRSTVLAWRKNDGRPLSPALSWQDRRASDDLRRFRSQEPEIRRITGLPLSPHYGAGKLRWLLRQDPGVRQALETNNLCLGPLVSYLLAHLLPGRRHLTDHSNAHRTLLFDIERLAWSEELLELFDIPPQCLPRPLPLRGEWGLLDEYDIPLKAVCGDQNAALYAQGPLPEKTAAINLGTGAFILMPCDAAGAASTPLLRGIAMSNGGACRYLVEGTVNGAGAALSWVQRQWPVDGLFGKLDDWLHDIQSPPLFINTVGGLGSPWWKTGGRPRFTGRRPIQKAARHVAVIESIVFLLQHNIERLRQLQAVARLHVSGGLSRLDGLCQRLADLSGLEVARIADPEATARGAAWLAAGCPEDWKAQQPEKIFRPRQAPGLERRYGRFTREIEGT
ncbi:MAG TPA: hypothetical protein ENI99_04810 [Sedimenticola sp.]|nr:hypothetical protein [Sedimenticola sp.]